jgi:hypothetical protein
LCVYTVLLIRDSTQVNLDRVRHLIKHLEDRKVTGVMSDNAEVKNAMVAERDAIRALLKCGNRDVRVASRLIGSLSSLVGADGMKSHT